MGRRTRQNIVTIEPAVDPTVDPTVDLSVVFSHGLQRVNGTFARKPTHGKPDAFHFQ